MKQEVAALEENKMWTVLERPVNRECIDSKWVYKVKRNSNGDIHALRLD